MITKSNLLLLFLLLLLLPTLLLLHLLLLLLLPLLLLFLLLLFFLPLLTEASTSSSSPVFPGDLASPFRAVTMFCSACPPQALLGSDSQPGEPAPLHLPRKFTPRRRLRLCGTQGRFFLMRPNPEPGRGRRAVGGRRAALTRQSVEGFRRDSPLGPVLLSDIRRG